MSLPESWVDRIFEKLALTYGHGFLKRWDGLDMGAVKADWAHELRGFARAGDAIGYGLQNLPAAHPPTVLEFRALCNRQPPATVPALPAPPLVPEPARVAALVAAVGNPKPQGKTPAQVCAEGLRKRMADGHKLTQNQRWVLDCCERAGMTEAQVMDAFTPVPADVLPPAMRAAA